MTTNIDRFFGSIFVEGEKKSASCRFRTLIDSFSNRVSPEIFTSQVRRIAQEYESFTLQGDTSCESLKKVLKLLDPSQIDLVKVYSWQAQYKFYAIELVFRDCSAHIKSYWTFDGGHKGELIDTFFFPIKFSSLGAKTVVQSWNGEKTTFSSLTEKNLQQSLPTFNE